MYLLLVLRSSAAMLRHHQQDTELPILTLELINHSGDLEQAQLQDLLTCLDALAVCLLVVNA